MLSGKNQKTLEEDPDFFLNIERVWEIMRQEISAKECTFDDVIDLHIGFKEGSAALIFLRELDRIETEDDGKRTLIRFRDRAPITEYRPKSIGPLGAKESRGKMCMLNVGGGGENRIRTVHKEITEFIFDRYASLLRPIEGNNYASVSANPSTGEMVFSFLTKPITQKEFDYFNAAVDRICQQYDKGGAH